MNLPRHILALDRNEQRVVILIVLVLLGCAGVKYYRAGSLGAAPPATPATASPSHSPSDEEQATPNDQ